MEEKNLEGGKSQQNEEKKIYIYIYNLQNFISLGLH